MSKLEVILKLAERCNINCTYCYVFNGQDDSYKYHSKKIKKDTIVALAKYLELAVIQHNLKEVQIDFHGGEPLIIGKNKFIEYCSELKRYIAPICKLNFCLQTNAILIDENWINIFEEYDVKVSTSLDGPQEINDIGRIDFKGHGTYYKTLKGMKLLQAAYNDGRLSSVGVICVINPTFSASKIYNHFVHELNLDLIEFLLPDDTHDTFNQTLQGKYGTYLTDLFDSWVNDDNPNIQIRILNSAISLLLGGKSFVVGFGDDVGNAITISSDGDVGPDDILRSTGTDIMSTGLSVFNSSYSEYLDFYQEGIIQKINENISQECTDCCWLKTCGATHPVHRFKETNGFSNKSIYCADMKNYFANATKYLLTNGLPFETLKENLAIN